NGESPATAMQLRCTDVKACAMGILVINTLDGEAVRGYFNTSSNFKLRERDVESELLEHPLGGPATICLARGLYDQVPQNHRDDFLDGEDFDPNRYFQEPGLARTC